MRREDHLDWFTGHVVGVHGYEISLFSDPKVICRIVSNGPWDIPAAGHSMDQAFRSTLEGVDPSVRAALGKS